jgi:hypothetical protein
MSDNHDLSKRSIRQLANIIQLDWKNVYFGAVPYLQAMRSLESVNDSFGYDDGKGIVRYFLSNARTWKGPVAKAVKAELNKRVK